MRFAGQAGPVIHIPPTTATTAPRNGSSIPYTFTGSLVASLSPPVRPHIQMSIAGLSATLGTPGTTNTVIYLWANNTLIATVTITAGSYYNWTSLTPHVLQPRKDAYTLEIHVAGTGSKDLGGEIEYN